MRRLLQMHTAALALAAIGLLMVPDLFLGELGFRTPSTLHVLSLTRIIAVLVAAIAAISSMVVGLAPESQLRALTNLSLVYAAVAVLMLLQEISVWTTFAGALLVVVPALFSAIFGAVYVSARRAQAAGA